MKPHAASAKRPRLWVPGVAYVSDERELDCGKHAGLNGWGKAFQRSACGHFGSIREWRHRVWLVVRADLDDRKIAEHAIVLPESLLDPDEQPNARRWLAAQPLLCVSGMKIERLTGAGLRVYQVEHGVQGEGVLAIAASGGGRAPWMLRGRIEDLLGPDMSHAGPSVSRDERREVRELVDRLLEHLSGGILREQSVVNAMAVRTLIEPGYGYHGDTAGVPASIDEVQRRLRILEALFAQIYEHADDAMRTDAREIARSVKGAAGDLVSLRQLPAYGDARRVDAAEMIIALHEEEADGPVWRTAGEPKSELVLPLQPRWVVERVALWSPKLSGALEAELEREERGAGKGRALALLIMVLVLAVGVWLGLKLAPELLP